MVVRSVAVRSAALHWVEAHLAAGFEETHYLLKCSVVEGGDRQLRVEVHLAAQEHRIPDRIGSDRHFLVHSADRRSYWTPSHPKNRIPSAMLGHDSASTQRPPTLSTDGNRTHLIKSGF
ncbi:MAG TPA: hypothetical protein DCQ06_10765 [Myxococcales bacterium]|nr:hypothetical protein [Myxococcales bacterium]